MEMASPLQEPKEEVAMEHLIIYIKGLLMGASDVIPGVSGGTIAFITGIYERLVSSIHHVDATFLKLLAGRKLKDAWKHVDGGFLFVLLAGVGTSIVTMSHVVTYLLDTQAVLLWSFFMGLIVASGVLIWTAISKKSWKEGLLLLIGLGISYGITMLPVSALEPSPLVIFFSGMIAISAMILPGISGSFLLLLMGQYLFVVSAVKSFDMGTIAIFGAGAFIGLLLFVRVLKWLLTTYHNQALAFLVGIMLGSLGKVWPWKETITSITTPKGEELPILQENLLPMDYASIGDPQMVLALIMMALGVMLVLGMSWTAKKNPSA